MREAYYIIECFNFNERYPVNGELKQLRRHTTDDFKQHIKMLNKLKGKYDLITTRMRIEDNK